MNEKELFIAYLPHSRSKSILENNEPALILFKFMLNNANLHDISKFVSVRGCYGIAS